MLELDILHKYSLWQGHSMGTNIFYLVTLTLICLLKTLTLVITFEQWMLELWYFTGVFLVTRPFRCYQHFLPLEFNLFSKNSNLANNFWIVITLILHMNISCDKVFQYILIFLTLWPWPWRLAYFVKTWTFLITFQQRVFIFHLNISCGKIFLLLLDLLTMTFHIEKKTPIIHNKIIDIRAFILHMSIFCDKIFLLVSKYLSLWL